MVKMSHENVEVDIGEMIKRGYSPPYFIDPETDAMAHTSGADWEERINFDRLRKERLERARRALIESDLDAIVAFEPTNVRYITGFLGMHSAALREYCLLAKNGEPILFAIHAAEGERARRYAPWLKGRIRDAKLTSQSCDEVVSDILKELQNEGVVDGRIGIDWMSYPLYAAFSKTNLNLADGSEPLRNARAVKTKDEIALLKVACAITDAAMWHCFYEVMKPGIRETDVSAEWVKYVRQYGGEYIRGHHASGDHTNPYHRMWCATDRILRPGDLLIIDGVQCYMGYYTCTTRTYLVDGRYGGKAPEEVKKLHSECYDAMYDAIRLLKPGNTTKDVQEMWEEKYHVPGISDWRWYTMDFGHGIGISLHEKPFITHLSKRYPVKFEANMVLAIETYRAGPKTQGIRLEEVVRVTETGYEVLSRMPFDRYLMC